MAEEKWKPNPQHTKKYSYKENYDFVANIWEKVAEEHKTFADFAADDLEHFFRCFGELPDHLKYFKSGMERKRFEQIKVMTIRKKWLAEANAMKKKGQAKEAILEELKKTLEGLIDDKQLARLLKNITEHMK